MRDDRQHRTTRFVPVRGRVVACVVFAVAAATWRSSQGSLPSWMPPIWPETNAAARDSIVVVGPLVAALGAWVGGWRHTVALTGAPARGWARIAAAQLVPVALAVIVGNAGGLVPVFARSLNRATAGGPQPLVVLSAWLALVALLVAGYAVGVAWRSRAAAVVAAVGTLPVIMVPVLLNDAFTGSIETGTQGRSFYSIALVWLDFAAGPGQREILAATVQRLVFFAAVAGSVALAAVRLADLDPRGRLTGSLTPFVVPVALGTIMLVQQPELVRAAGEQACEQVAGATVCVPADIEVMLEPFSAGASAVMDSFGYGAIASDIDAGVPMSDYIFVPLADSEQAVRDHAAISTARAVAGMATCELLADGDDDISQGGRLASGYAFANDLAFAMVSQLDVDPERLRQSIIPVDEQRAASLAALPIDELRLFVQHNQPNLSTCSTSPAS